ncbi:MAG: DUF393 domain-containing protein [Planctomycetaceae bacterium]|nr:DUF393 domain-containing protein [Planctomycetaceae bacterium]
MSSPTASTAENPSRSSPGDTLASTEAAPIVFFDGVCGLCNASVDFILSKDRQGLFRFAPLQGETAAAMLTPDDIASLKSLVLRDEKGRVFRRSTAIWRILWTLGGGMRILGAALWAVPWPLRNIGYRTISASRYRLFGKKEACRLPTPAERRRFLP